MTERDEQWFEDLYHSEEKSPTELDDLIRRRAREPVVRKSSYWQLGTAASALLAVVIYWQTDPGQEGYDSLTRPVTDSPALYQLRGNREIRDVQNDLTLPAAKPESTGETSFPKPLLQASPDSDLDELQNAEAIEEVIVTGSYVRREKRVAAAPVPSDPIEAVIVSAQSAADESLASCQGITSTGFCLDRSGERRLAIPNSDDCPEFLDLEFSEEDQSSLVLSANDTVLLNGEPLQCHNGKWQRSGSPPESEQ